MNQLPLMLVLSATLLGCASTGEGVASRAAGVPNGCVQTKDFSPSDQQTAPTTNSIQVQRITPEAGTTVQRSTLLVADLAYTVKDFDSGKFLIFAQFDTNQKGRSTDGNFNNYLSLKYPSGAFRLCYPMIHIWSVPDLKKPLSVRFVLNKIDDPHHNHVIASTERFSFDSN
jgi:hypothetical protein